MNNEEQIKVLQMVADGIVSIEEGENLLDALEDSPALADEKPSQEEMKANSNNRKWLRYLVIDKQSGVESVNLRLSSKIFSGWFIQKRKFNQNSSNEIGDEKHAEDSGMFLNILGENDGKRFKLYFE